MQSNSYKQEIMSEPSSRKPKTAIRSSSISIIANNPQTYNKPITGVLFLQQNYGRQKSKLLYRCVPTDPTLPPCLIPYNAPVGFFKKPISKYVLFRYVEPKRSQSYLSQATPPNQPTTDSQGQLESVFGSMDGLNAYYDYLLHSKNLFYGNPWAKQTFILPQSHDWKNIAQSFDIPFCDKIENVFTIDSANTVDFDDALQYQLLENGTVFRVSVYITCVAAKMVQWFQTTQPTQKRLVSREASDWIYCMDRFTSNSSTVYLPHRRIPMFLDFIAKQLTLSKTQNEPCLCIAARFSYDLINLECIERKMELVAVNVIHNWSWEEAAIQTKPLQDFTHDLIAAQTRIPAPAPSTDPVASADECRNTVAFWMIQYNQWATLFMKNAKAFAWFRKSPCQIGVAVSPQMAQNDHLNLSSVSNEFKFGFDRIDLVESQNPATATAGTIGCVVPMTNPMRRVIDLLNQYCLLFYQSVFTDEKLLDYFHQLVPVLNQNLRDVYKVQRDCKLLDYFHKNEMQPREFLGMVYHPVFDSAEQMYYYSVFFRDLGVYLQFRSSRALAEDSYPFRLYYFKDALQTKQKIRISLV